MSAVPGNARNHFPYFEMARVVETQPDGSGQKSQAMTEFGEVHFPWTNMRLRGKWLRIAKAMLQTKGAFGETRTLKA
jgi:hypothetical protein